MKCDKAREEIKAYIDGELGLVARISVARHLAHCAECRSEAEAMADLSARVRRIPSLSTPDGLEDKVMANVECKQGNVIVRPRLRLKLVPALGIVLAAVVAIAVIQPILFVRNQTPSQHLSVSPKRVNGTDRQIEPKPTVAPGMPASPSVPEAARLPRSYPSTGLTIIKTANLALEVKDFQKAYDQAVSMCQSVGGYVTTSSAEAEETEPASGTMTIRVPVASFDHTVERLCKLGVVKSKSVSGDDITGQVVDLNSRLRNIRAEERQYLDIMNKANKVPDIVTVSNELYRVRGEIEVAEGQLKYLQTAAAMSTININLSENEGAAPLPTSTIGRAYRDAVASLGRAINTLVTLAIWFAVYSPFWLIPVGVVIYTRRRSAATPSNG